MVVSACYKANSGKSFDDIETQGGHRNGAILEAERPVRSLFARVQERNDETVGTFRGGRDGKGV